MSFRPHCIAPAALILLLSAPAFAAPPGPAAILAAYKKEDAALLKRDVGGFFATHHPQYEVAVGQGKSAQTLTRKDYEPSIRQQLLFITPTKSNTLVSKTEAKAGQVTADVAKTLEGTAPDFQNPDSNRTLKYAVKLTMRDVWVKSGANWRKRRSRLLNTQATIDGKPFALPTPAPAAPRRPR